MGIGATFSGFLCTSPNSPLKLHSFMDGCKFETLLRLLNQDTELIFRTFGLWSSEIIVH